MLWKTLAICVALLFSAAIFGPAILGADRPRQARGHTTSPVAGVHITANYQSARHSPPAPSDDAPASIRAASRFDEPLVGFGLSVHHTAESHRPLFAQAIDDLHQMGFNCIKIVTPAYQRHGASEEIGLEIRPGHSAERAQIVELLTRGRQRDMTTVLMPIVLFTHPRGNEWRGKIAPENWDRWWASYRRMMTGFLDIAIETDASVFVVGSELISTEKQTERWRDFIQYCRTYRHPETGQRFQGLLTYSTNWDHFHVPQYWDRLDLIGISAYWNLTRNASDPKQPTDAELRERWTQIQQDVLGFAREQNRPAVITELGYPTLPWALRDPWNYIPKPDSEPDGDTQARGYASFLEAWEPMLTTRVDTPPSTSPSTDAAAPHNGDEYQPDHSPGIHPQFAGVFFYNWDVYHQGGPNDFGYGVRGKPAMRVFADWLARNRPTPSSKQPAASQPAP